LQRIARMRGCLALVVVAVTTTTVAAKPGALFIPPAEVDIGAGSPVGDVVVGTSTELRVGMHWASLYWKPTALDIGIGYAGSYRDVAASYSSRSLGGDDNLTLKLHGLYFNAAYAIETHKHWRTWLGARVEGLTGSYGGETFNVFGAALRLAAELYSTGVGAGGSRDVAGFWAGAFALGVYVETTRRFNLPAELGPNSVGAGITMRVPFIAAIGS
jgi:hypothetical protein